MAEGVNVGRVVDRENIAKSLGACRERLLRGGEDAAHLQTKRGRQPER